MAIELPLHSDPAHLAVVRAYSAVSSPVDESFARLTRLAARLLDAPGAFISLTAFAADKDRPDCQGCAGLPALWTSPTQLTLAQSFYRQMLDNRHPAIIDDVRANSRLREAGIAQVLHDELKIGACLAVPLTAEDGRIFGTLGVVDTRPRRWALAEVEALCDLGATATAEIELRVKGPARPAPPPEIDERIRPERGFRRQKEILQTIFDHIPMLVAFFDQEGRLQLVNRYWEQTLGWSLAEAQAAGDIFSELYPQPDAAARARDFIAKPGASWEEFSTRARDGSVIELSWIQIPLSDHSSIGISLNVTEQRQLEGQLRQAQKMEAVGRLASGVAHDFNNMLTIVLGQCDLAAWTLPLEDPLNERIREIRKAGERAAALTKQLLIFSRKQVITTQLVDLGSVIEGVDRMMRRVLGEDIELTTLQSGSLWPIFVDPGQMEQVLINLVVNSRDAMPQGGRLTIETQNATIDEAYCRAYPDAAPGDYVRLSVSDTGIGMDAATMARIFDPFFTTKSEGKGTGLGLATVYGIVKQGGGHLEVRSMPGVGTSFRVYLPRAVRPEIEAIATYAKPQPQGGTETILLVEDNELVRDLAKTILQQYGYRVFEAANGDEALSLYRREGFPLDLLVTDVVMPAMGGRQLAEHLTRHLTELKVLYLSGYTDDSILRHGVSESEVAFLQKPFTPEALAFKVREVLDKTGRPRHRR